MGSLDRSEKIGLILIGLAVALVLVGSFIIVPLMFFGSLNPLSVTNYAHPSQITDDSDRIALIAAAISFGAIVSQLLGGILLAGALFTTFRTMRDTRRSIGLNERQLTQAERSDRGERFSRALDQIGELSEGKIKRKTRMGAAYSLEMILKESDEYYLPILEIATAYVRDNAKPTRPDVDDGKAIVEKTFIDDYAMLKVLANRSEEMMKYEAECGFRPTIEGAWLPGVNLRSGNLSNLNLNGVCFYMANLRECDFRGSTLDGAFLNAADLSMAKNLTMQQIDQAYTDSLTFLPAGNDPQGAPYRQSSMPKTNRRFSGPAQ